MTTFKHKRLPSLAQEQERQVVDEFRRVERFSVVVNEELDAVNGAIGDVQDDIDTLDDRVDTLETTVADHETRITDLESNPPSGGGFVGGGGEIYDNQLGSYQVSCNINDWRILPLFGAALSGNVNITKSSQRWAPTQAPKVLRAHAFVQFDMPSTTSPTYDSFDVGIHKNSVTNHFCGYGLIITSNNWDLGSVERRSFTITQNVIDLNPLIFDAYGISIRSTQRTVTIDVRSCNFWLDYE